MNSLMMSERARPVLSAYRAKSASSFAGIRKLNRRVSAMPTISGQDDVFTTAQDNTFLRGIGRIIRSAALKTYDALLVGI
jgi:hypothetical protein